MTMDCEAIRQMFNRAASFCFCSKKLLLTALTLLLCGVLLIFFQALALYANQWVGLSLAFMPFFLCSALLMSLGIVLIRLYRYEVKQEAITYKELWAKSWKTALGASYLAVPFLLSYLLLWMALGFFVLLTEIPMIGPFLAAVLAFAPFLINLATLLLALASLAMLYFLTPEIAFKGLRQLDLKKATKERLSQDLFDNLLLGILSLLPFVLILTLLLTAAALSESVCLLTDNVTCIILQWFVILIPFSLALSPCVVFSLILLLNLMLGYCARQVPKQVSLNFKDKLLKDIGPFAIN